MQSLVSLGWVIKNLPLNKGIIGKGDLSVNYNSTHHRVFAGNRRVCESAILISMRYVLIEDQQEIL